MAGRELQVASDKVLPSPFVSRLGIIANIFSHAFTHHRGEEVGLRCPELDLVYLLVDQEAVGLGQLGRPAAAELTAASAEGSRMIG